MKPVIQRYATPLITGLFLVSLISGIALFFHWNMGWFHGMHEWLSMVLILPFALHLWKNWRPMTAYMRKPAFGLAMVASLVMAVAFVVPSLSGADGAAGGGRPPQFAAAGLVLEGSVAEVAALIDVPAADLGATLTEAGFAVGGQEESLASIARASGRSDGEILAALIGAER
ncbi:DUF4405 domain-containing protein [Salipiger sp. PrR002]|uniref:DUF4405 domain-containing protein n=1 Tax=Salipiger sp. PrR002 TaxID=2706489 RepID=UPI0013B63F6E|nr:DUF4405 domain-containing protein [Salipiger sp. PrR002]NDV98627.1 DUF4405 domain-containing protein [Salipiger sp. PrR002]NDW57463.1 DUF4405 domain-containing protein [Salipiger sp. PrR004]